MVLFILIFKIKLHNNKTINDNGDIRVRNKGKNNNYNNNNRNYLKKFN